MTTTKPLTDQGAVLGASVSTTPTTKVTDTAAGAGGILGVALVVWSSIAKDPAVVHWVSTVVGGGGAAGALLAGILARVRAAEAEVAHAVAVVEKGVVSADPAVTPQAINSYIDARLKAVSAPDLSPAVQAEVAKQLAVLFPTTAPK